MTAPKPYREFTFPSVFGGIVFGAVLNAGIVYAGLQIGFTIVGSAVAAVVGFGLLRGLLRIVIRECGSILEVNIFQTVASAVNTVNAGVIFTVPVLFLLGLERQIHYPALLLAAVGGSLLGVVMIIPLRKQVIEYERLRFPEGVATAMILKSPGAGIEKALLLLVGLVLAGSITALTKHWGTGEGHGLLKEAYDLAPGLGLPAGFTMTLAVSLLSLGAGFIAGRPGLVVLYGTLLNYWVLVPIAILLGWVPEAFRDFSLRSYDYGRGGEFHAAFSKFTSRPVGIGMILGGAIAGILVALPALKSALSSLRSAAVGGRREELSIRVVQMCSVVGLILVFLAAKFAGGTAVGWSTALIVTLAGGAWLWLAGLVVAQTTGRTDWSPLSGLALIAIAIMMGIMGSGPEYVVPAVTLGAAICVATSMCADMIADLKTGYLVGGLPIRQQIAEVAVSWIGPGISLLVVTVLWRAYAFGPEQSRILYERRVAAANLQQEYAAAQESGEQGLAAFVRDNRSDLGDPALLPPGTPKLQAPQAGALKAAIEIVQSGDVPLGKYLAGAVLALVISLLVSPGLGVMIGLSMYLPFEYMAVFGIGGLLSMLIARWKGARFAEDWGLPVAAGFIVGDALVGVVHAVFKVATSF